MNNNIMAEALALAAELREIESRSKGALLKRAADMLESLVADAAKDVTDKNVGNKTRADRIRAMSDDELAWELMEWRFDAFAKAKGDEGVLPDNKADILKWLKRPIVEERQCKKPWETGSELAGKS